jgi:hypothetical protein
MNDPPRAFTAPSCPSVSVVPAPEMTAPRTTKMPQKMAAVLNRTILVATAVPNTLAASLAPSDHPRNSPLERKSSIIRSTV